MDIGDRVMLHPQTFGNGADRPDDHHHTAKAIKPPAPPLPGTVTFCHPSGRWYQVTFDCGIKECFFFRCGADTERAGAGESKSIIWECDK